MELPRLLLSRCRPGLLSVLTAAGLLLSACGKTEPDQGAESNPPPPPPPAPSATRDTAPEPSPAPASGMSAPSSTTSDAMASSSGDSGTNDWPRWRGPDANGIAPTDPWIPLTPQVVWKARVGTGFSSISISDGRVYTKGNASNTDRVSCLDEESGQVVWTHDYPAPLQPNMYEGGPNATPAIDGGRVYTFSKQGLAHCLDAGTGSEIWKADLKRLTGAATPDWGFSGSPLVEGGQVIFNIGNAGAAVDKTTGKLIWSNGRDKGGYATPVPIEHNGKRLIAIFGGKNLLLVDHLNRGQGLWAFPWKTQYEVNSADPIVIGARIFISSGYGSGCALVDFSSGRPRQVWRNTQMRNHFNPCVAIGGHIYGIDGQSGNNATLKCLEWSSGRELWNQRGVGSGSLIASDNKLIVLSNRGELMIAPADPSGFKPAVRAQVLGGKCWTAPAFANGHVFCRNAAGELVRVKVSG